MVVTSIAWSISASVLYRPIPYRIEVRFRGKDELILLDQMRTLDRSRLVQRLGAIDDLTLSMTLETLREMFEE